MSTKQKWTHVLQDVVKSYNNSVHRTLGRKPAEITPDVVGDVREKVFSNHSPSNRKSDIKVGDTVRISKVKSVFAKGYLPNWTEEIFTVASINRKSLPLTYKLKDYNGEIIEGSFYREEIEHVIHESDEYIVEKVLRTEKRGNEKWSLVKWSGYPSSMNSWVRSSDILIVPDRQRM